MPYKSEKIRIAGTQYDRRIKLTPDQKEYIKWFWQSNKDRDLVILKNWVTVEK